MLLCGMLVARLRERYEWVIAATCVLVVMGALGFGRFGYAMILPAMSEGLGLDAVRAGDLATANMVGYLVFSLACGFLSSRFGPRIIIVLSMIVVSASLFLTGLSFDFRTALGARLLTGMASGGANVPAMGLLSAWFSTRRRGLASGMVVGGSSLGLVITGLLVPAILVAWGGSGWRVSWFALGAGAALVAVLSAFLLRNSPHASSRKSLPWSSVFTAGRVWFLGCVYLLFGFSYIIFSTFFVRYLTSEAGFSTSAAGAIWSGIGALSVGSGFLWGTVSDRLGRRAALTAVFVLQAVAFTTLGVWRTPAGSFVAAFLFAMTAWSIPAIMAAATGDIAGPMLAPSALGFITVLFGIGQAAGPFAAGRIAQSTGSLSFAFLLAGAAALLGGLLSLFVITSSRTSQRLS